MRFAVKAFYVNSESDVSENFTMIRYICQNNSRYLSEMIKINIYFGAYNFQSCTSGFF